jgi:hypothetical protein
MHAIQEVTTASYIVHFKTEIMTQLERDISYFCKQCKWGMTYSVREESD